MSSTDKSGIKKAEKRKKQKKERAGELQEGEGVEDGEGPWEKVKGGVPLVKVTQESCI